MTQRTVEGPAVISPSTLPDVQTYSRFGRRDSDVVTMSTVSTGSMSSTTSISTRATSVFEFERSSRRLSWSARARQAGLTKDLFMAAVKGECTEIENIIGQGANVNSRHDIKDLGPEHSAIPEKERPKFFPQHRFERTPLHYGAEKGNFEAVQCLLRHVADCTMKSRGDMAPLHVAKGRCAGSIRSAGADLLARDSTGSTPMHYMAASGDLEALRIVLREASPDQTNKQQQTPLHLACEHGHAELAHALLSARSTSPSRPAIPRPSSCCCPGAPTCTPRPTP